MYLALSNSSTTTRHIKTYQFELNNFQRGVVAPTAVTIGTAPVINGFLLNNINSKMAFEFMIPLDWDETDMQFMAMVCIPAGVTATVGNKIQMKVQYRITRSGATTKANDTGIQNDTDTPAGTGPFGAMGNDNVILIGKNTEFYTYMPHVFLPSVGIGGVGGVLSGEVSLQDIGVGNVSSIVLYQLHLNYYGIL